MTETQDRSKGGESRGERLGAAAIGLLFLGVAVLMLLYADPGDTLGVWAAILAIAGLGAEALISALRGRRSLLSRIGPLP